MPINFDQEDLWQPARQDRPWASNPFVDEEAMGGLPIEASFSSSVLFVTGSPDANELNSGVSFASSFTTAFDYGTSTTPDLNFRSKFSVKDGPLSSGRYRR